MSPAINNVKLISTISAKIYEGDDPVHFSVKKGEEKAVLTVVEGMLTGKTMSGIDITASPKRSQSPEEDFWVKGYQYPKTTFVVTIIGIDDCDDCEAEKCKIGIIVDKSNATKGKNIVLPPTPYLKK